MSTSNRPAKRRSAVPSGDEEEINISVKPVDDEEPNGNHGSTPPPAPIPPNGGGQVPGGVGTQVGTSTGTNMGRKDEGRQDDDLDFSLESALSEVIDPDQDWRKSGWAAKRYRKKSVEVLVSMKWRGYKTEQALVDAALAAFLPQQVMDKARTMATRGEL